MHVLLFFSALNDGLGMGEAERDGVVWDGDGVGDRVGGWVGVCWGFVQVEGYDSVVSIFSFFASLFNNILYKKVFIRVDHFLFPFCIIAPFSVIRLKIIVFVLVHIIETQWSFIWLVSGSWAVVYLSVILTNE